MVNKEVFTENIKETIEECSFPLYAVTAYKDIKCTCYTHVTKQPSLECKTCLGTGHKIRIKRITAAVNEKMKGATSLGTRSSYTMKKMFIDSKYVVKENDLLIDEDDVYYIHRMERKRGVHGIDTHNEVTAIKRKSGHDVILKNFNNIISKYKKEKANGTR